MCKILCSAQVIRKTLGNIPGLAIYKRLTLRFSNYNYEATVVSAWSILSISARMEFVHFEYITMRSLCLKLKSTYQSHVNLFIARGNRFACTLHIYNTSYTQLGWTFAKNKLWMKIHKITLGQETNLFGLENL